jgi:acyl-CoA oxidase
MQTFVGKIKTIECPKIRAVLTKLCLLYALTNFLDDNWGDCLQPDQFRLIKQGTDTLLKEIRPDAVPLVDAFDYGDHILKSSIGRYDGNIYEELFDSAQKSVLNRSDPFDGYKEHLRPHLNIELLKRGNKQIPSGKL